MADQRRGVEHTGVELVTDKPADGVKSITTTEASDICWGK